MVPSVQKFFADVEELTKELYLPWKPVYFQIY